MVGHQFLKHAMISSAVLCGSVDEFRASNHLRNPNLAEGVSDLGCSFVEWEAHINAISCWDNQILLSPLKEHQNRKGLADERI
jgi:hypothetical protein